jgi:Raf kinase inhibitor-like YbhB/YbcL family protein
MRKLFIAISLLVCVLTLISFGCQSEERELPTSNIEMTIISPAFGEGEAIPIKYTCDGEDTSPALVWSNPPEGALSLVIIVDDPDAPGKVFTHWLVYNLSSDIRELAEGVPVGTEFEDDILQGKNDFGTYGYSGPCPPSGETHQYRFTIYALDKKLDVKAGIVKNKLLDAINNHIIASGQFTANYTRQS